MINEKAEDIPPPQSKKENMKSITVATYNIRHGHDVSFDWSKIAEIVTESGADILGLQEIDMHTGRVGGRDSVAGLAQATGLPHALFVPAMDFDGGKYGTAILSRYPIQSHMIRELYYGTFEPRSYGIATVTMDDGSSLAFVNTHLSCESDEARSIQIKQIAFGLETRIPPEIPAILAGDFNTDDFRAFEPYKAIGFALVNNEAQPYKTFRNPPAAIDHIIYRESLLTLVDQGMLESDRSDHNLLWARFEIL